MKTILLMTDFSKNARNAIKYAIQAFGEDMEYILMTSYIIRSAPASVVNIARRVEENCEEDLKSDLDFIKSTFPEYPNLKITTLCEYGDPSDVLKTIQKQNIIDLVVMGTKGASGLIKVLVGSVTASVIRSTPLPVLAVPENAAFTTFDKIVFASDLHPIQNENLVKPLKQIAEKFDSDVMLLKVLRKGGMSKEKANSEIGKLEHSGYLSGLNKSWNFVESDHLSTAIEQFCEENQAGLLVVIARHSEFFDRIFHSSVSQQLVFHAKLPILALDDSFIISHN